MNKSFFFTGNPNLEGCALQAHILNICVESQRRRVVCCARVTRISTNETVRARHSYLIPNIGHVLKS